MSTPRRHGGDLVLETLEALDVEAAFGVPGQNALGLFDALSRSSIDFFSSRIENNAAFAADGYSRSTGKVSALFLSTGPGALTALAGLQEAYATSVPVVVIVSQIPSAGLGGARKGMLHQLDDQQAAAINVAKRTWSLRQTGQIPAAVQEAYSLARSAPAGPVWVEIPQDILLAPASSPRVKDVRGTPITLPVRGELLDEAARLLSESERPVILAGGGARRSGAGEELRALAERLDAPVVSTIGGKGVFPWRHRLSAQSWIEDRFTTELLEAADVLLVVGSSMGEVTSNYFTFVPRGRLIQVDAELRVLESNHPALGIHADAKLALAGLLARIIARERSGADVLVRDLLSRVHQRLNDQDLALEQQLLSDIRAAVPEDADTFWDMTIAGYWAWSAWDPQSGGFHSAQGAGGLGFAFPAAVGSALGSGKRTLAVTGDGGSMYSIAELASARQHNADVTWLIIDDGGYGILREYMVARFGQATATELASPDFTKIAAAFGLPAYEATPATVRMTLERAWREDGPNVVVLNAKLAMFTPT